MTPTKNEAAIALQALRKTKSGGRNGGRPRVNPAKPPRAEPFDQASHLAKMRAAKAAKRAEFRLPSLAKLQIGRAHV